MSDTLKRAEELLAGITPGEWETYYTGNGDCMVRVAEVDYVLADVYEEDRETRLANTRFFAAAPALVRELVAEVKALREENEQYRTNHALALNKVKALREENAALRTALSGRTYCHSDEAVNAELAALAEENRKYRMNIEYILENTPGAVRVREGAGQEEIAASLAVTWSKLMEELTSLRGVVEKVREVCEEAEATNVTGSSFEEGQRYLACDILSLLPEVPK